MVIVLVRWYIRKNKVEDFKRTWENMVPKTKDGLFREFFSKPVDIIEDKYHTLDLESQHYITYINVGAWRCIDDFNIAIGSMIPGRSKRPEEANKELIEVYDFEFKLRERIVMDVEIIRGGEWVLPASDF